ncbi:putative COP9 signalosome complex subunit 2 [Blattamonas nauphoetae]|uniref:COP9 signalosome complex subunit 2 n=1 Tax=Blattamonas nauphoetae TaxID=2049346 RepID=A0ABQ9XZI2_9EUKA|nr:putative COP9 signalosome complex subunit 2 [Blattamonas nauphoetae]
MSDYEEEEYEEEEEVEEVEEAEDESDADNGPEEIYEKAKEQTTEATKIKLFLDCIKAETGDKKGEYGFKAHKNLVKIYLAKKDWVNAEKYFTDLLTYISNAVPRNTSERVINKILDAILQSDNIALYKKFIEKILDVVRPTTNERLLMKISQRLVNVHNQNEEYNLSEQVLVPLIQKCMKEDNTPDENKITQLLEIYALLLFVFDKQGKYRKVKEFYEKASAQQSSLLHPRFKGMIAEVGGKMHMRNREFYLAYGAFFEAFKNYNEAALPQRVECLKYVIMSSMLAHQEVNPMEHQETRSFKTDPSIFILSELIEAYQSNNVMSFNNLLADPEKNAPVIKDEFIQLYIEDVRRELRISKLKEIVRPFTSVKMEYLAKELMIKPKEAEVLCAVLVQDGDLNGKLDQVKQVLLLEGKKDGQEKYTALKRWAKDLSETKFESMQVFTGVD